MPRRVDEREKMILITLRVPRKWKTQIMERAKRYGVTRSELLREGAEIALERLKEERESGKSVGRTRS